MDNLRLILVFSLAFILLLLWQAWQQDYGPKPLTDSKPPSSQSVPPATTEAPTPKTPEEVPTAPVAKTEEAISKSSVPTVKDADQATSAVNVVTDLYRIEIDTKGGTIRNLFLNDYPVTLKNPDEKFQLMSPTLPNIYLAQSGLLGNDKDLAPSHQSTFRVNKELFELEDGKDTLSVDLIWQESDITVTKRFIFTRGSYLVEVKHILENGSEEGWTGREYRQLMRTRPGENSGSQFIYTYTGGAIYSPEEKYEKISFDEMDDGKLERVITDGWLAMLQHYFLAAWIPPRNQKEHFYTNVYPGGRYVLGAYSPAVTVPPGGVHTFSTGFVAGPKLQEELAEMATGLDLSVDYGWLTILSQPIFWLLKWIYSFLGNWGWSIIVLTLLIKLAFYKLSETSYKSMANMRKLTPRIQALRDRYGDDKARLNQAMMDFYKKEKINPLGGCLPILVQIPVFIALYWVLLESVELRQAPFILWIKDLSIKDPFFVLPLVMGVSMFIQQKLNPAPPDPLQAKIMMSLPFVFTIFFAFFPAGLVLYWVVNNILSIAQQWYITRKIEQAG